MLPVDKIRLHSSRQVLERSMVKAVRSYGVRTLGRTLGNIPAATLRNTCLLTDCKPASPQAQARAIGGTIKWQRPIQSRCASAMTSPVQMCVVDHGLSCLSC